MKKLINFFMLTVLTLFVFNTHAAQEAENSFNGDGTVKTLKKEVTFVKSTHDVSLTSGSAVCYDETLDDAISVKKCGVEGQYAACMLLETCAAGALCRCLEKGYTDILQYDGSGDGSTAGQAIYVGTTGRFVAKHTPTVKYKIIGEFLNSSTTSGSVKAFVNF